MKIRYIFIFFILLGSGLLILDIFVLKSSNIALLKEQREANLKELPKDKPIKIGVAWPFPPSSLADDFKNGILLAVKELETTILDRKIEVVFRNDELERDVALNIANEFAKDKDIVAVIAHDDVDIAIPASIIYEYSGIIMIAPAVSSPDFTRINFDYIFRNTPSDIIIGQKLANFAKFMNFKKLIILNSRDEYSESLTKAFTKKAIEDGLEVIYDQKFNPKEREFAKIITDISPKINRLIDYDAIFIAGDVENVPALIEKAREYGIFAPFITGDMLDSSEILEAGEAMNGTIVATIYNKNLIYKKTQDFIDNFKKIYGHYPDTWGAQGYDAVMLLATAIKKVDSLNGKLIYKQLKYMHNYDSIFGKYSLNTKGDVVEREIYFKVVKNGKFYYIKGHR